MPSSLNGTGVTFNDATTLQSGNIPTANLGTGTANANTFLAGDKTWKAAGDTITANASGSVTAGRAVVLNSNGTVSQPTGVLQNIGNGQATLRRSGSTQTGAGLPVFGTAVTGSQTFGNRECACVGLNHTLSLTSFNDNNQYAQVYVTRHSDGATTNIIDITTNRVDLVSASLAHRLTFNFNGLTDAGGHMFYHAASDKFVYVYSTRTATSTVVHRAVAITVNSDLTVTFSALTTLQSYGHTRVEFGSCVHDGGNQFVFAWSEQPTTTASTRRFRLKAFTFNGTSFSVGSEFVPYNEHTSVWHQYGGMYLPNTNRFVFSVYQNLSPFEIRDAVLSVSGNVITLQNTLVEGPTRDFGVYDTFINPPFGKTFGANKVIDGYVLGPRNNTNNSSIFMFTGSGNTFSRVTVSTPPEIFGNNLESYFVLGQKVIFLTGINAAVVRIAECSFNASTLSLSADNVYDVTISPDSWLGVDFNGFSRVAVAISGGSTHALLTVYPASKLNNVDSWTPSLVTQLIRLNTSNANNVIGLAANTATNGQPVAVNVAGTTNTNQSGLTAGRKAYIDGTGVVSSTVSPIVVGTALSSTSVLVDRNA
jgi:hypothetical protein